ncbi:Acid protease [Yarrowia sp. B02]|nr:Acid protease [Yarrowia sp. B02]
MIFSNLLLASVAAAGVVHLPLSARQVDPSFTKSMLQKRGVFHGNTAQGEVFYIADLELGTPAQKVAVCFDTGSGHLWVPGKNSTDCLQGLCREGQFDISASSSWRYKAEGANWYGHGLNGNETVSYAGATLENFNLYVSTDTMNNDIGIFGQSADKDPELSFVQGLAAAKKISRAVYSIVSDDAITTFNVHHSPDDWIQTKTNVYYGGYDSAKYEGPLVSIDVDHYGGYAMPFAGFSVNGEHVPNTEKHQLVLDTGGINPTVSNATMKAVAAHNGGKWDSVANQWAVSCRSQPVVTYDFGYTSIDLNLTQFIDRSADVELCNFQFLNIASDNDQVLLQGPQIISKAFLIYDNDRNQIHIARAKYTSDSKVEEITGDIPGAVLFSDFLAGKPLSSGQKASTLSVKATSSA